MLENFNTAELGPDKAEFILSQFSRTETDSELETKFNSFMDNYHKTADYEHFDTPTIVFLIWMQDEKDNQSRYYSKNLIWSFVIYINEYEHHSLFQFDARHIKRLICLV